MRFDFLSFLIGFIVGIAASVLVYDQREALKQLWQKLLVLLRRLRDQIAAGVETRYRNALRSWLDQLSLPHKQAEFDQLYILQRFDPPPLRPSTNPPDPATLKPISLSAALRSTQRLTVRGEAGSGRTTLLIKIARTYLDGQVDEEFGALSKRLPIYVHLAEIDWGMSI
jgi:hypothetical protein